MAESITRMGDVADVVKMAEVDLAKRMGENIGRPFTFGEVSIGRTLTVYSVGAETGRCSIGDQEDVPRTYFFGDITNRVYGETIFGLLDDGRKMINTIADEGST